jgi:prepilin-type N-terminal cleavage/methylation domain-containing protein
MGINMQKIIKARGFTLIELLVVIAIIGILAGIVLASLGTARNKGKDASVQESMSSMRAAEEIYYGNNGNSYGAMAWDNTCATPAGGFADATSNMAGLVTAVKAATSLGCGSNGTAWVAAAAMPSGYASAGVFCVDSTGVAKANTTAGVTGAANAGAAITAAVAAASFKCN